MSKEDIKPEWLSDLSKLAVGGNSVPSASGLVILFKLTDVNEKPEEAIEKYEKKSNTKYYWKVHVESLSWVKEFYKELLTEEKPDKLKYIEEFETGKDSILKLSPTATKQFAKFLEENAYDENTLFKHLRTGVGSDTVYKFKIETEKAKTKK